MSDYKKNNQTSKPQKGIEMPDKSEERTKKVASIVSTEKSKK